MNPKRPISSLVPLGWQFHPHPHSSTGDSSETFLAQFHVMGVVLQSNYKHHVPVRLKSSNVLRQKLVHPKDTLKRVMWFMLFDAARNAQIWTL